VLYSQRYDYYVAVGSAVAERIAPARSVLDAGCGIGLLTTFYAGRFPQCSFTGLDRSPASIAVAQEKAAALGLTNVRFECLDVERSTPSGSFDLIVATQALLQTEKDPGLPSRSWQTFERGNDPAAQADFERRTGLAARLDRICAALTPDGRLIVCEKTRHLARRVPFQRAFAARGLALLEPPLPIHYAVVEEGTDDGPLYVFGRPSHRTMLAWDESPEQVGETVDVAALARRQAKSDEPLYENHQPSAQQVWAGLPDRRIIQEITRQEPDGRQVHLELGESQGLTYLYCANTFDQRQLAIVKSEQGPMLAQYYQELVSGLGQSSQ
jgi:SAM-dependent methyltransferase